MRIVNAILLIFLLTCCSHEEMPEVFSIEVDSLEFDWNYGVREVELTANKSWSITSELPDWLNVEPIVTKDRQKLRVIVSENKTDEKRHFDISLSSLTMSASVSVSQDFHGRLSFKGYHSYAFDAGESSLSAAIDNNVGYDLQILDGGGEWITNLTSQGAFAVFTRTASGKGDEVNCRIAPNYRTEDRSARIVISNPAYELSDTLLVSQAKGIGYHPDGEVVRLQQSFIGDTNLIIMGDGFSEEDLRPDGNYDACVQKAFDYFFNVEPYSTYREYFNVYTVYAASRERGVSSSNKKVNTKFKSVYGEGTGISCDDKIVFEYASKIKGIDSGKPMTVIIVLNDAKYAGTTLLYKNGNSIALCPMPDGEPPSNFEGIVHHEAGGHGFGFLCDEYVYSQQRMPTGRINALKEWQELGFQMNLDFTNNLEEILWKDFIGLEGYEMVGAYEGGYEYQFGVWRSEQNSCMNNNVPYFNVQSRWLIVKRILEQSGKRLSLEDFLRKDRPSTSASSHSRSISESPDNLWEGSCVVFSD